MAEASSLASTSLKTLFPSYQREELFRIKGLELKNVVCLTLDSYLRILGHHYLQRIDGDVFLSMRTCQEGEDDQLYGSTLLFSEPSLTISEAESGLKVELF